MIIAQKYLSLYSLSAFLLLKRGVCQNCANAQLLNGRSFVTWSEMSLAHRGLNALMVRPFLHRSQIHTSHNSLRVEDTDGEPIERPEIEPPSLPPLYKEVWCLSEISGTLSIR